LLIIILFKLNLLFEAIETKIVFDGFRLRNLLSLSQKIGCIFTNSSENLASSFNLYSGIGKILIAALKLKLIIPFDEHCFTLKFE